VTNVLPAADEKPRVVEAMFDRIAPRYDLLNRLLTFRMDVRWRRATVNALRLAPGARVLDVACGTGDLCNTARDCGLQPIGVDFSLGMLTAARSPAPLVRTDAACLPFADATFDGLTCGFALRNFASLPDVFHECTRVLRPGARIALLDVSEPRGRAARAVHGAWFRHVVPLVGGLVSDRDAYRYLPASTSYLPTTAELFDLLQTAGVGALQHRTLGAGAAQLITGTRAS